jgi:hypothetical protein
MYALLHMCSRVCRHRWRWISSKLHDVTIAGLMRSNGRATSMGAGKILCMLHWLCGSRIRSVDSRCDHTEFDFLAPCCSGLGDSHQYYRNHRCTRACVLPAHCIYPSGGDEENETPHDSNLLTKHSSFYYPEPITETT